VNRLAHELHRVFGEPPAYPRAVVRIQVGDGQGLAAGRDEGDRLVDAGCELVVLDSDLGSHAVQACLAALLGLEPAEVTDRQSPTWATDVVVVRDLLRGTRDPWQLLDGGLGRLVGLLDRLTERRTPVLLGSGTATATAALAVVTRRADAEQWLIAGSNPDDAHARLALTQAGLTPLLDLGLGAIGADVAVAVVRAGLEALGA
jgi:nicotinate-nucleotide--dimethylbenzimidazole phosphoribosyltransferase